MIGSLFGAAVGPFLHTPIDWFVGPMIALRDH